MMAKIFYYFLFLKKPGFTARLFLFHITLKQSRIPATFIPIPATFIPIPATFMAINATSFRRKEKEKRKFPPHPLIRKKKINKRKRKVLSHTTRAYAREENFFSQFYFLYFFARKKKVARKKKESRPPVSSLSKDKDKSPADRTIFAANIHKSKKLCNAEKTNFRQTRRR